MAKLKCWFVEMGDDGSGVAVISTCASKAIKRAADDSDLEKEERGYCTAEEKKKVVILPKDKEGDIFEAEEGLRREAYGDSGETECECEICKQEKMNCIFKNGKIVCWECVDEA